MQTDSRYNVLFAKTGILHVSVKNDKGAYEWQTKGKGQVSVRTDKASNKAYISFNLEGVSAAAQGQDAPYHMVLAAYWWCSGAGGHSGVGCLLALSDC